MRRLVVHGLHAEGEVRRSEARRLAVVEDDLVDRRQVEDERGDDAHVLGGGVVLGGVVVRLAEVVGLLAGGTYGIIGLIEIIIIHLQLHAGRGAPLSGRKTR